MTIYIHNSYYDIIHNSAYTYTTAITNHTQLRLYNIIECLQAHDVYNVPNLHTLETLDQY